MLGIRIRPEVLLSKEHVNKVVTTLGVADKNVNGPDGTAVENRHYLYKVILTVRNFFLLFTTIFNMKTNMVFI